MKTQEYLESVSLKTLKARKQYPDPFKNYKPLDRGNSKLTKGVFSFSLLPVVTCKQHCEGCYDIKALRYSDVRRKREYNTWLAIKQIKELESMILDQIQNSRSIKFLRIHVGGDFFSRQYLKMWGNVAEWVKTFRPEIKIYTYTKNYAVIGFLKDCGINVVKSLLLDNRPNFDTLDNLKSVIKQYPDKNYKICPATMGKNVKCGDCKICIKYQNLLFVKH